MILNNRLRDDLHFLLSRLSEKKINELKQLLVEQKITKDMSLVNLHSKIDLNTEELKRIRNLLKDFPNELTLPIIIEYVQEFYKQQEDSKLKTTLVWTGPVMYNKFADNTSSTMIEMINSAKKTIIMLEFVMTHNTSKIFQSLINASKRGVSIKLVFNDGEKEKPKVHKMWEPRVPFPNIYSYNSKKKGTSLHAKVLIVDSNQILTTSANLTGYGIDQNIEMGIKHTGPIAHDAENIVELLIDRKYLVKVK